MPTGDLRAPDGAPERLTERTFPAYRYVPRRAPHPVTHPEGHSYGRRDEVVELGQRRLPADWESVEEYLYGIDLFNAAYFWEAHESWEAVWHAVDRDDVVGRFLQGLIQGSASLLQRHCGRRTGAGNLWRRSRRNLEPVDRWLEQHRRRRFMGIDVGAWQRVFEAHAADESVDFPFLVPRRGD